MTTVAIIGCGRIARNAHLPALSQLDDVRIKYVCDIDVPKAEKLKADFPKAETVISDYKVALEDAIEADKTFSILMGDKVEPRREFIEQNAKYVQNLDI